MQFQRKIMLFEFRLGLGLVTCKNAFKIHWLYRNDWELLIFMNKFKWGSSLVLVFSFRRCWGWVDGSIKLATRNRCNIKTFCLSRPSWFDWMPMMMGGQAGQAMNNLCFGKYMHKCLVGWWTEFNDPETNRNETSISSQYTQTHTRTGYYVNLWKNIFVFVTFSICNFNFWDRIYLT